MWQRLWCSRSARRTWCNPVKRNRCDLCAPPTDNTIAVAAVENDDTSKKGGKGRKEGVKHKKGVCLFGRE